MKYGFNKRYCPCLICLKQPICSSSKLSNNGTFNLMCGTLARYVAPNGLVIPLRYLHVKKIFPNLNDIRYEWNGEPGGWLDVPSDLTLSEVTRKYRYKNRIPMAEYVMPKKMVKRNL